MRGLRSRKPIGFRQWVVHDAERYPYVEIAGGIKYGDSEEDVRETIGSVADEIYVSDEYNYKVLTYQSVDEIGYDKNYLELTIYGNEMGVSCIDTGVNITYYILDKNNQL